MNYPGYEVGRFGGFFRSYEPFGFVRVFRGRRPRREIFGESESPGSSPSFGAPSSATMNIISITLSIVLVRTRLPAAPWM